MASCLLCLLDGTNYIHNTINPDIHGLHTRRVKKTDSFHIHIPIEFIAGIRQSPSVQRTGRGYYLLCESRVTFKVYSFIYLSHFINSNSELNLCFRIISGSEMLRIGIIGVPLKILLIPELRRHKWVNT